MGLQAHRAQADEAAVFVGWQGYDEPLFVDDMLANDGITLETTYIGNNDEIVTKLQTGGIGTVDVVTPYMGYVPLLAETGLIDPIDESRVPNLVDVLPLFRNDKNINHNGELYAVPIYLGRRADDVQSGGHTDGAGIVDGSIQSRSTRVRSA